MVNEPLMERQTANARPVILDLWAEWCAPCRRMAPMVERLAAEYEACFVVSLVGYTMENTTLGMKRAGDVVNLEADVIAKYVENLKEPRRQGLSIEFLREYGFVGGMDAG